MRDRIWGTPEAPENKYAELFQAVERPFILYLALLLHDGGKALRTGNHAEAGGQLAARAARRLELDGATSHSLRLVIEHHLSMAMVSQRRDLDDPAVIRSFAGQIQTAENLRMLTLHTLADSQATGGQVGNRFEESLLREVDHEALPLLVGR